MAVSLQGFYVRPDVSIQDAVRYARDIFGLKLAEGYQAKELPSYNDRNFLLEGQLQDSQDSLKFVFKVMNSMWTYNPGYRDAANKAMLHFGEKSKKFLCPRPIRSLTGQYNDKVEFKIIDPIQSLAVYYVGDEELTLEKISELAMNDPFARIEVANDCEVFYMTHYVSLVSFIPGISLAEVKNISDDLLWNCGVLVADIQNVFKDFNVRFQSHKGTIWSLHKLPTLKKPYLLSVRDPDKQALAAKVIKEYENVSELRNFPRQMLHGDVNEGNVICRLVSSNELQLHNFRSTMDNDSSWSAAIQAMNNKELQHNQSDVTQLVQNYPIYKIEGIIDFGDIIVSYRVFELAICIAYVAIQFPMDLSKVVKMIYGGFSSLITLEPAEIEALPTLIKARITQSLIIGSYQSMRNPENTHVSNTSKTGWEVLKKLDQIPRGRFLKELLTFS